MSTWYDPEYHDYHYEDWTCEACGAQNSDYDGECQFCDCEGDRCKRVNCSAPEHFHSEHKFDPLCNLCKDGAPSS